MLLLDTHTLLWLMAEDASLGKGARRRIHEQLSVGDIAVSSVSFWEIALLLAKQRIHLDRPVNKWRLDVQAAGIQERPMTGDIGILSVQLAGLHGDPADRLIAATCLADNSTLVTADRRLLGWSGGLATLDARL